MKNKMKFFYANRRWLASFMVIAALVICVVIAMCAEGHSYKGYDSTAANMNDGWYSDDGDTHSLSELSNGEITLHHSVDRQDFSTMRFCLKSVDTFFEVLADGETIYSYCPRQPAILGKSYGMYIHSIPVPEDTSVLTLKLTPIYPEAPPAILNAVIEDPGMFIGDLFNEGIPGFSVCLIMMILGMIMIVAGASINRSRGGSSNIEVFTLGIFAVLVAVWSVNDTLIMQVLTQSPALVRLLNYLTLIVLPYFIVSFIASATGKQRSPLLTLLFVLICIDFILNITLTVTGISDYFSLVKVTQAVIVIALAMSVYFVVSAIRHKNVEKRFLRTFVVGLVSISIGAGIDLISFRISTNVQQVNSFYARMGSLVFLVLIGLYLIQENRRVRIANSKALTQLAYTDGLTGLKNRLAFNKAESYLSKEPDAEHIIIQFDINDLKKVNDVYGHAEGDRHITAAAEIIHSSFSDSGNCYRVGGDEFIAIVTGADAEETANNAIQLMERLTEEYNARNAPPVMLDIAYGMAAFTVGEGDMEKSVRLADRRMYECKRIKKAKIGADT